MNLPLLWSPGRSNHVGEISSNLGDLIIEQAVRRQLASIFGKENLTAISTHLRLGPAQRRLAKEACHVIVGGSNLLSSYMDGYFQWDLTMHNALSVHRAILMGAGWWKDQGKCNRYTQLLLHAVLSWKGLHSVRDNQALQQLHDIRIRNVVNTGCPTMWDFAGKDLSSIHRTKGRVVLTMLTDYYPDPEADRKLFDILSEQYEEVVFWPQGRGDLDYAVQLGFKGRFLDHSLRAFDDFLEQVEGLDYIGTRLHGGVRCLHSGARCLILEVDNRAREIGRETGIPTAPRGSFDQVRAWIHEGAVPNLKLPVTEIERWKKQFSCAIES